MMDRANRQVVLGFSDILEVVNIGGEVLSITTAASDGFYVIHSGYFGSQGFVEPTVHLTKGEVRYPEGEIPIEDPLFNEDGTPWASPINQNRLTTLIHAEEIVDRLVSRYDMQPISHSGNIIASSYTTTPAEQHVSLIIQVADWLLEKEKEI